MILKDDRALDWFASWQFQRLGTLKRISAALSQGKVE
jgi:hypothetical protein